MQLSLFVAPRHGETLYSIAARYKDVMNIGDTRAIARELFDRKIMTINNDLPGALSVLSSKLDGRLSIDEIIQHHTAFRYYAHLVSPERRGTFYASMERPDPPQPSNIIGLMASGIHSPSTLLFCRDCVAADRIRYLECHWHLEHQRPGVLVCATHLIPLTRSSIERRMARSRHQLITLERAILLPTSEVHVSEQHLPLLTTIATGTLDLLQKSPTNEHGFDTFFRGLTATLIDRGFSSSGGRIRQRKVEIAWRSTFSNELYQQLDCGLEAVSLEAKLRTIKRSGASLIDPLVALVLSHILDAPILSLLGGTVDSTPSSKVITGHAAYSCRNPDCGQGSDSVEKLPGATGRVKLYCRSCHSVYTERTDGTGFRWQDRGIHWRQRLFERAKGHNLSAKTLCEEFDVDFYTLMRFGELLELNFPWKRPPEIRVLRRGPDREGFDRRVQWAALRKQFPFVTAADLRRKNPTLADALYRYDKDWYVANKPRIPYTPSKGPKLHAGQNDAQLSLQLLTCVKSILSDPRPTKVTQAELERRLRQPRLFSKTIKSHFPLTIAAAALNIESTDDFVKRRILLAVDEFMQRGQIPTRSFLKEYVGIRGAEAERWSSEIDKALTMLRNQSNYGRL